MKRKQVELKYRHTDFERYNMGNLTEFLRDSPHVGLKIWQKKSIWQMMNRITRNTHRFLSNAGYEVTAYKNGDTLFSVFQEKPCDLVILDIMMPGSDGLSICKKLRTISSVPIIILKAKDSESDHMKGFMYGGDDYLIKPFSPSLLVVRVNALFPKS